MNTDYQTLLFFKTPSLNRQIFKMIDKIYRKPRQAVKHELEFFYYLTPHKGV